MAGCARPGVLRSFAVVSTVPARRVSADEYLALERVAAEKHELWDGVVFAMGGAGLAHNVIAANLTRLLGNLLVDRPCVVLPSDMKVHVPSTDGYVYPDVSVVCGDVRFVDDAREVITNPSLIVEVLSPSTERFDRGDKFAGYRSLPSVECYLLVSAQRVMIEQYERREDGAWVLLEHRAGGVVRVRGIEGGIAVDEVYRRAGVG